MSVAEGCEAKYKTPVLEERVCPECGETVEVFTRRGRIVEDTPCDCGYVFREEAPAVTIPVKKGGDAE